MRNLKIVRFTLVCCVLISGCESASPAPPPAKAPRPVSVIQLKEVDPGRVDQVTGLVGSWKTEDLGFEVSGRVQFVIEPERDVDGEVFKIVGEGATAVRSRVPTVEGTVLAKLGDSRYQYVVNSVRAQIETAIQQKNAASIEATKVLPAQRDAALANLAFAKSEVERNRPLVESRAISKTELDRVLANYATATAKLAQVDATKLAKEAEVASLQAKADELKGTLAQAELDVEDCELRSPFRGQVAQVHVIPGGVVQAGQPVVTVQMMDPIKVELEVSAATSRQLNYRDIVDVTIPQPPAAGQLQSAVTNTNEIVQRAIVYTIDPVADPVTRTFTVTLLMRNEKVQSAPPPGFEGPIARVRDVWRLRDAPFSSQGPRTGAAPTAASSYFVDENAIHRDGDAHHVWKIKDWQQVEKKRTPVLNVSKVYVIPGDLRMDWLGLWTFREVAIADGEDFDVERDFVAGEISSEEPFQGDRLLWDWQRWRVRPGDLVTVDLEGGRIPPGFFVPMDTICLQGDQAYVFAVEEGQVQRVEVISSPGPNTLRRIEAAGDHSLIDGISLVAGGVHYLVDGEAVNVLETVQVQP
jgi:biotin carboxyl carrier protein